MSNEQKKGYLYLILTFLVWGSMYVVSKFVLGKMPAFGVAFFRFLVAYIALRLLSRRQKPVKIAKEDYGYLFIIGFLGYFISVGMQLMGTKLAGASLASLINSMNPVVIIIMAAIFLKEQLTIPKIAGIVLSLLGVCLLIGTGYQVNVLGVLLSIGAVLGWSFMSVITSKVTQKYDALTVTRTAMGITVICDLPVCIYEFCTTKQPIIIDASVVFGILYIGLFCTALTLMLWNKSLSILHAGVCSAFYPIQTLTSSALGILLFQEAAGLSFWAGTGLIAAGVLISLLVKSKPLTAWKASH